MQEVNATHEHFGEIAILFEGDNTWFPAIHCAKTLGYTVPRKAVNDHCEKPNAFPMPHPQNPEKTVNMKFITESDLYRLIIHSKLPAAKKFQVWVFEEVLPSIRKTGGYVHYDREEEFLKKHYDYLNPELMKQVLEQTRAHVKKMAEETQEPPVKMLIPAHEAT